jgi:hypothetical protein
MRLSSVVDAENLKQTLQSGPDAAGKTPSFRLRARRTAGLEAIGAQVVAAPSDVENLMCAHEVDRDGHARELEALAELVLDPVAVVARCQARIVDEDRAGPRSAW